MKVTHAFGLIVSCLAACATESNHPIPDTETNLQELSFTAKVEDYNSPWNTLRNGSTPVASIPDATGTHMLTIYAEPMPSPAYLRAFPPARETWLPKLFPIYIWGYASSAGWDESILPDLLKVGDDVRWTVWSHKLNKSFRRTHVGVPFYYTGGEGKNELWVDKNARHFFPRQKGLEMKFYGMHFIPYYRYWDDEGEDLPYFQLKSIGGRPCFEFEAMASPPDKSGAPTHYLSDFYFAASGRFTEDRIKDGIISLQFKHALCRLELWGRGRWITRHNVTAIVVHNIYNGGVFDPDHYGNDGPDWWRNHSNQVDLKILPHGSGPIELLTGVSGIPYLIPQRIPQGAFLEIHSKWGNTLRFELTGIFHPNTNYVCYLR